jgi:hypothetical protein
MNPPSENPKDHWKELAAELGFEPSEPETPPEAEGLRRRSRRASRSEPLSRRRGRANPRLSQNRSAGRLKE